MSAFPEYLSTQTVTIDNGSIEFISNYREAIQTLQQKAHKLRSDITATNLMRRYGCPFASLNSDTLASNCSILKDAWDLHFAFIKNLVQWIEEQQVSQGDSIGVFDDYFQEMIGYQKSMFLSITT